MCSGTTSGLLAVAVVVAIVLLAAVAYPRDRFFTRYAREEPTRSYVPYTGTLPLGEWGPRPWAEATAGP